MPTFNVTVTPTQDAKMVTSFRGRDSKTISVGPCADEDEAIAAALAAMKVETEQCKSITAEVEE